jgi:HlyD family type I secretion membrane fusion protein
MTMNDTPKPTTQVASSNVDSASSGVGAATNNLPKATKRPTPPPVPSDARSTILAGALIVGVTFLGLGGWAASAPLASGIIGIGSVVFEGRRQVVQHLEGGIIAEINVREGDRVEQGDLLLRLDPTQPMSRVARIRNIYATTAAQAARLRAEAASLPEVTFPEDLMAQSGDPEIADVLLRERSIFDERRRSLEGQLGLLAKKATQFEREIEGLDAQEESNADQIVLVNREIDDLRPLLDQGLVQRPRVTALEREAARLRGLSGEITSRRARANEGIAEAELQAEQIQQRFREEVVALLREAENQLSDLRQQLVSANDIFNRLEVRAPQGGIAQNVNITTVGSVIQPGEPLLQIAPMSDRLLVEARISPQDIDSVASGQRAEVRLSALDLRRTPAVFGNVVSVSGDSIVDARLQTEYFLVQINVPVEELEKLGGQRLQAGMPAEVVFPTGERTVLDYLIKPLSDALRRGLHER